MGIKAVTGVTPDAVKLGARHTLFIEGEFESFDYYVFDELLRDTGITIKPLGYSPEIRWTCQALHKHHPEYYFIIDRDYLDENVVNDSWNNFPNPGTHNLLIWRKRELENYFIEPDYLAKSGFLKCSVGELKSRILGFCRKRIYMEAANLVILEIREKNKAKWIECFTKISEFGTKKDALKKLVSMPDFGKKKKSFSKSVTKRNLEDLFNYYVNLLTDGCDPLKYGCGKWLKMVKGKPVLNSVVSQCFKVVDQSGKILQRKDKTEEIIRDLLKRPLDDQPADFKELHKLIKKRVKG